MTALLYTSIKLAPAARIAATGTRIEAVFRVVGLAGFLKKPLPRKIATGMHRSMPSYGLVLASNNTAAAKIELEITVGL